jgi:site-specific DNA-methyltransferase (adenine-specific)
MPQENISVGKGQNYLLVGDNAIWLKKIPDNSIDSIVTDPPAGISFMGRGWDTDKGGRDHWIAWMQEVATECKRVLKPGGHAFVWAIPRTSHWTATAWENAGFEIRDVVAHIFGSGFPKSLNIGKAVDKLQGNERETVGIQTNIANKGNNNDGRYSWNTEGQKRLDSIPITKGTSEWEGWGTALKPAREDWLLMRKPLSEKTVAENVLKWGTGGMNIDESRVENTGKSTLRPLGKSAYQKGGGIVNGGVAGTHEVESEFGGGHDGGRFPANLILEDCEEVRECFPDTKSGLMKQHIDGGKYNVYGKMYPRDVETIGDSGNASRFFKSIIYQAKSSKSERTNRGTITNTHPTTNALS